MNGERDRHICARADRQMEIRLLRQVRRPRIDHHQLRPALLRLADERDEVNARRGGIRAPQDDQARLGEVLIGD
jgi:hypothetical protein